jgi:hypothetical protein
VSGDPRELPPLEAGDRPIYWQSMPAPIKALGKKQVRLLMKFGTFPKVRMIGASGHWSAKAVARWCAELENAAWLRRENERLAHAVESWEREP